jgi:small subunit ribosomal protein S16
MRLGKIRAPYYRIVVADSRTKRDGRVIETIGKYHPKEDPSFIEVNSERAQYWLSVGAQATEPVAAILRVTGDWQRFKGEPAPTEGVRTKAPRPDRKAIFEAAAKESLDEGGAATTPKKSAAQKTAQKAAAAPAAEPEQPAAESEAAVPAAQTEAPAAETPEADAPAAETAAETPEAEAPAAEAEAPAAEAEAPAPEAPAAESADETPADS